jgi:alpha-D-ribose 1-methylphosphonate 5-triphosphate synthase subunit PhnH
VTAAALAAGFAVPVDDSQRSFRAILDAMARPGRVVATDALAAPPPGLSRAQAAVALTLCDLDTPVWLDAACAASAAWLRFHAGTPIVAAPGEARFAFSRDASTLPALSAFALGTVLYPDRSTTLVLEVEALAADGALALRGPGIRDVTQVTVTGPAPEFWRARGDLAELFPRGLDLILTCGARLMALPRSTRTEA